MGDIYPVVHIGRHGRHIPTVVHHREAWEAYTTICTHPREAWEAYTPPYVHTQGG